MAAKAKAQLIKASAGGAAPLVTAHAGGNHTTSAPLVSAPSVVGLLEQRRKQQFEAVQSDVAENNRRNAEHRADVRYAERLADERKYKASQAEIARKQELEDREFKRKEEQEKLAREEAEKKRLAKAKTADALRDERIKAEEEERKRMDKEAEQARKDEIEEQWNTRYGQKEGTRLTDSEKKNIESDVRYGRKIVDYSDADKAEIAEMEQVFKDELAKTGGVMNDDLRELRRMIDKTIESNYKKGLVDNPNGPTAEQRLEEIRANGGIYLDEKGNPQRFESPEDAHAVKEQERKDKWLDGRIKELMENSSVEMDYKTAYEQAMKEMAIRFPEAQPTPTPTPTPTDAPQQREWNNPELAEGYTIGETTDYNDKSLGQYAYVYDKNGDFVGVVRSDGSFMAKVKSKDGIGEAWTSTGVPPWAKNQSATPTQGTYNGKSYL